jgi:hypothetical protein
MEEREKCYSFILSRTPHETNKIQFLLVSIYLHHQIKYLTYFYLHFVDLGVRYGPKSVIKRGFSPQIIVREMQAASALSVARSLPRCGLQPVFVMGLVVTMIDIFQL